MGIKTKGEKVFDIINIVFMGMVTFIFIAPLWTVLATSFLSVSESARRGAYQVYVEELDFSSYRLLLSSGSVIYNAYFVTILRTVAGTFCNLAVTIPFAYGLSKKDLPGKTGLTMMIFFTMLFGGGLIPNYILVNSLGLVDSFAVLIIPGLVSAWNTLLLRNFFSQLPESLEESAMMDGASVMTVLIKIILPLSLPSIVTIGMFHAVGHWNAWFDASIYINSAEKYPLQVILRRIVNSMVNTDVNNQMIYEFAAPPGEALKSAAIIVTTVPILCIYPFIQKYFVKGVLVGSIKG